MEICGTLMGLAAAEGHVQMAKTRAGSTLCGNGATHYLAERAAGCQRVCARGFQHCSSCARCGGPCLALLLHVHLLLRRGLHGHLQHGLLLLLLQPAQ